MTFAYPLFVVLLALPALLFWRLSVVDRRGAFHPSAGKRDLRHRITQLLRPAALSLLVLALMQPRCSDRNEQPLVVALDASRSIAPAFLAEGLEALAEWPEQGVSTMEVAVFADNARLLEQPSDVLELEVAENREQASPGSLVRQGTNLEQLADLLVDAYRHRGAARVLLMSDGRVNRGETEPAITRLRDAGFSVFTLAAPTRRAATAQLLEVTVPDTWQAGAPATVHATVSCQDQPLSLRAVIRATSNNRQLAQAGASACNSQAATDSVALRFEATSNASFDPADPWLLELQVNDPRRTVDSLATPLAMKNAARVLMVSKADEGQNLARILRRSGFVIDRLVPGQVPATEAGFEPFDAVILANVDPIALPPGAGSAIESSVRERGLGLLFLGGPDTYGEDGYEGSAIESTLPVRFEVEEEESEVTLMIALDKSYSMRGEKIELAKSASSAALDVLEDEHRFGMIAFDWNPTLVVPIRLAEEREEIKELISRVEATAQTNFYPALEMAHARLLEVESKVKHVILLSDGKTYPDAYERLLRQMAEDGVSVSTVAVGEEADRELLESIAGWGGGRNYFIADAREVVSVLVDEAKKTLQDTVVEESVRVVAARPTRVLEGLALTRAPRLEGHVRTGARDRAEVWLETPDGTPLLASWQYGLGHATLFASDLDSRWSANWLEWREFPSLIGSVMRDLSNRVQPSGVQLHTQRVGHQLFVDVAALSAEGEARNGLALSARLRGTSSPLSRLQQTAPGTYSAALEMPGAGGSHLLEVLEGERVVARQIVLYPVADEDLPGPPAFDQLERWAEQADAEYLGYASNGFPTPNQLGAAINNRPSASGTTRELWPGLCLAALMLFLIELVLRRVRQRRRAQLRSQPA